MASRLGLLFVAVLLVAGCGPYGQLKDTVETLEPEGAETIGKCQEYGAYVIDTPGYGCSYFVPGDRRTVSRALAERLHEDGFRAVCEEDPAYKTIHFRATRGGTTLYAHVSRRGSVIAMHGEEPLSIYPDADHMTEYRAAPPGHVIVKLVAHDEKRGLSGGTRECREYAGIPS